MEIPIQVAVRIFPCIGGAPTDPNANDIETDANGNPQDTTSDTADAGTIENGNRYCVQAIPMAAPTFLGSTAPGLGGQLSSGIASGIVQVGQHSFPVTYSLPIDCTQGEIYHQTVFPLINLFMEGFDASVVTYGQRGTGKSYTLFGPGFDCVYGEAEQGVAQRCVREIFAHMANHPGWWI